MTEAKQEKVHWKKAFDNLCGFKVSQYYSVRVTFGVGGSTHFEFKKKVINSHSLAIKLILYPYL